MELRFAGHENPALLSLRLPAAKKAVLPFVLSGNPAILCSLRPVAFRRRLAAGLAWSIVWYVSNYKIIVNTLFCIDNILLISNYLQIGFKHVGRESIAHPTFS
jgi:hypothetical protein